MADKKISELTALTGANVATDDQLVIVDTSAALTKNITIDEFKNALDTATGFVRITGDTMTGDLSMGDNVKAIFGAGSDLQIYHDGSGSFVDDQGTGGLILRGTNLFLRSSANENYLGAVADGSVTIYHDNAPKLATTSTGVDITGTLTSDGLTVDSVDINGATIAWQNAGTNQTYFSTTGSSEQALILRLDNQDLSTTGYFEVQDGSAGRKVLTVEDGGDISFYEDTGTTAKFFWDASAESLGVGTTNPTSMLDIKGSTGNSTITLNSATAIDAYPSIGKLRFYSNDNSTNSSGEVGSIETIGIGTWNGAANNAAMTFNLIQGLAGTTSPVEAMRITSDGDLQLSGSTDNIIRSGSDSSRVRIFGGGTESVGNGAALTLQGVSALGGNYADLASATGGYINFRIGTSNAMRLDASGNTHIGGTTSITTAVTGDNVAPKLIVEHSTATSIGILRQDTSIVSGNSLGSLGFYGTDTTSNTPTPLAGIQALASGTHAAGDNPTDLRFFTTPDGSSTMAEAMRIDSSQNVTVAGAITAGANSGVLKEIGSDLSITQGAIGLRINDAASALSPTTASANNDNAVDLGVSNIRFKDLYLSGGVFLGGTGSSNKLEDYEEGSVNMTLGGASSDPSVTYTTRVGYYVKVGRLVHLGFKVSTTAIVGGSGTLQIEGLPFAATSDAQFRSAGIVSFHRDISSASSPLTIHCFSGGTYLNLYKASASDMWDDAITLGDFTGGVCEIHASITYQTDS